MDRLTQIASDHDPIRYFGDASAAVGPGADCETGVQLIGHVALGFSCYVSEDSRLEDTVIMPEAWVGPRCRLFRSVIAQGVELPTGFVSEDELICADTDPALELPPSTRRQDGMLIYAFNTVQAE